MPALAATSARFQPSRLRGSGRPAHITGSSLLRFSLGIRNVRGLHPWTQLACRQRIQCSDPFAKFHRRESSLPVVLAQKIACRLSRFRAIALRAAGHQVAIRIPAPCRWRHNVIESLLLSFPDPPQAIETESPLAGVNRLPYRLIPLEVRGIEICVAGVPVPSLPG